VLNFFNHESLYPIPDSFGLLRVHLKAIRGDDHTKELGPLPVEVRFGHVNLQSSFSELSDDFVNLFSIKLSSLAVDKQVDQRRHPFMAFRRSGSVESCDHI
jgi:hypothetical protein